MTGRHDFRKATVDALAKRVAQRCSNPQCRKPTSGPSSDPEHAIVLGVAAHITAASEGGPRYAPELTEVERRSAVNGIWLCQTCGKLIDADEATYPPPLLHRWKHDAEVEAAQAAASPDPAAGSEIARLEAVLSGHTTYVWDVAVSPDGQYAISASNDHSVRLWDLSKRLVRGVLTGHSTIVCSAAIDPSGTMVAAGAYDGSVRIWDPTSLKEISVIDHGAPDAKVAWTSAGRLLTAAADGSLRIWSREAEAPANWSSSAPQQPHNAAVLKMFPLPSEDTVVTVSADGTAVVWNLADATALVVMDGHAGAVNSVAVTADGRVAVSGGNHCNVRVWDVATGECSATLAGHLKVVWRVAISPTDGLAASGSGDNTVRLWSLADGACIEELTHPDCVAAIAFDPAGRRLVVGCDDAKLYVYNIAQQAAGSPA